MKSPILLVAVAATMLSIPAIAEDGSFRVAQNVGFDKYTGEEIDTSFAASRTRLEANGYRGVKRVHGDALWLAAFDPQGSAVLLTIDPQTGEIDQSDYVHAMDR